MNEALEGEGYAVRLCFLSSSNIWEGDAILEEVPTVESVGAGMRFVQDMVEGVGGGYRGVSFLDEERESAWLKEMMD